MFEVGERAVCVDARSETYRNNRTGEEVEVPSPLVRGRTYTVLRVWLAGDRLRIVRPDHAYEFIFEDVHVDVGLAAFLGCPAFHHQRFRRLRGLDISHGLARLRGLADADAGREVERA